MSKWLTKSDYLKYLLSPAYLWLKKHAPDRLPPFDAQGQFLVDQGNAVETIARRRWPEGVLVAADLLKAHEATAATASAGATTLFQAAVLTARQLHARADVLVATDDGWDIYEIKSSTKVKPEHHDDLAFQRIAFEEAGYPINRTFLVHINRQYERRGEIDPRKYLLTQDVTDAVLDLLPATKRRIEAALAVMALPECPDDSPLTCGNLRDWLPIYRHLHADLPDDSIYNLCRISLSLLRKLKSQGVDRLQDIPLNLAGPVQRAQLLTLASRQPSIHLGKIAHQLDKLQFPLHFLDYETVFAAIPLWDGGRPYDQLPFQYSVHILREPGGQPEHREFLARGTTEPTGQVLEHLRQDIGDQGSIVAWNKTFEAGVNNYLAVRYPKHAGWLKAVNKRLYDLMDPFWKLWYVDHRFGGSASLKNVLPVLVPALDYKELSIQDGSTASQSWYRAASGEVSGQAADQIYADLLAYCGQDTLAMVEIYRFLDRLVTPTKTARLPF